MKLKYSILLIIFILFIPFITKQCYGFEIETRINKSFFSSENVGLNEIDSGLEYELRMSHKNIFIWGSIENIMLYSNWQDIKSIGLGFKKELNNLPFTIWLKAGYYVPKYDQMINWEAGYIAQNKYYSNANIGSFKGDYYAVNLNPNYGAEIGIDFKKEIFKNLSFGLSASYRMLNIYEHMDSWKQNEMRGSTGWIMEQNRNFSGFRTGLFLTYTF